MKEIAFQLSETDRAQLIEQYQPYVRKLARQTFVKLSGKFALEDLVSYGTVGLIEAADRYNPQRGVSFLTFSHYRIKGAIFDGLKQMGLPVRLVNRYISKFERNANALLQAASDDETNESARRSVEDEVRRVEQLIDTLIPAYFLSLDTEEAKSAPDKNQASAQEEMESHEIVRLVRDIVEELPAQEKELLEALYFKHQTMTDLAAEKGITKSWVSRLHTRAIHHIRDKLKEIGFVISEADPEAPVPEIKDRQLYA